MQPRIDYLKFAPEAQRAMYGLEKYLAACGLEHKLLHLLKLRASQINGCAYCIDMHSKDARAVGEPEQRLYELDAWRETPFLHRPGTRRAGVGRIRDPRFRNARPRCRLRRSEATLQRKRSRGPYHSRGHHQYVEPPGYLDALRSRAVPAGEI